jgi:hypothetical protein
VTLKLGQGHSKQNVDIFHPSAFMAQSLMFLAIKVNSKRQGYFLVDRRSGGQTLPKRYKSSTVEALNVIQLYLKYLNITSR